MVTMAWEVQSLCLFLFLSIFEFTYGGSTGPQNLFNHYDSSDDNVLSRNEFETIYLTFDHFPYDYQISHREFIIGWANHDKFGFKDENDANLFFLETDKDHDFSITVNDIDKLFNFFDDAPKDGVLSSAEFLDGWSALYGDVN